MENIYQNNYVILWVFDFWIQDLMVLDITVPSSNGSTFSMSLNSSNWFSIWKNE